MVVELSRVKVVLLFSGWPNSATPRSDHPARYRQFQGCNLYLACGSTPRNQPKPSGLKQTLDAVQLFFQRPLADDILSAKGKLTFFTLLPLLG